MGWIQSINQLTEGEIIAIDGKTLRRSYDKRAKKLVIHMVSAWGSANGLVLGIVKIDEKSNEITAIPELLKALEIKGCIVTIDAMGCQKDIAKTIIDKGGDYVLSLKGNQGNMHEQVELYFQQYLQSGKEDPAIQYYETTVQSGGGCNIDIYHFLRF